jgi:hypothetical protein
LPDRAGVATTLAAVALLAALTNLPYLRAALDPPAGTRFVGFFYYIDDSYNYLSYVQQAEDGHLLFVNKMVPEPHAPGLVNLEWSLVGGLSRLLGRRPALAYRLFGILAAAALVFTVDRLLARRGLTAPRRFASLLLVFTGAGLGGVLLSLGVPGQRCLDLVTGLFPFIELLANPHFTAGTLLLLAALLAFASGRAAHGVALGTALGLVRPYDLGLLIASRALGVLLTERPPRYVQAAAPLLGLVPVLAYNYWFFLRDPRFATYASATYAMPPVVDFLPALGPAAGLASLLWRPPAPGAGTRAAELHLAAWAGAGLMLLVAQPVPYPLQFMVGLGLPLLTLAAIGLARWPLAATGSILLVLGGTALTASRLVWTDSPRWHVPAARLDAALLLRPSCTRADLALTPPDIGLYTAGLTACRVYVGHPAARGWAEREQRARAFYGAGDPAARGALLDEAGITRLVLPGDAGDVPVSWLGAGTPFRRIGRAGAPPAAIGLYARSVPAP